MSEPADPSDLPHNAESVRAENMLLGLDPAQHQAVTSKHNPLAILTGAGSGKTRVLTRRITHRVEPSAIDPTRTMAATITRKTAGFSTVEVDQVELTIPADDPLARMTNGLAGLPIPGPDHRNGRIGPSGNGDRHDDSGRTMDHRRATSGPLRRQPDHPHK